MIKETKSEETTSKKDFEEIVRLSKETVGKLVNKEPLSVISLNQEKGDWVVVVEVLERKAVPDSQNLIGKYRLSFGKNKEFLGYKRIEIRKRSDTGKEFPEEEEEIK
ncbi:MAG: gas vesicle protein GvpO [Candidatus Micrarchaeota archaeon]